MPTPKPKCSHVSPETGRRCERPPLRGKERCYSHDPDTPKCTHEENGKRCGGIAVNGTDVCTMHGASTPVSKAMLRQKLLEMVEPAFKTLNEAMAIADYATAVRAAQIILDRAGFGPKATLSLEEERPDFSKMSKAELLARTEQLAARLRRDVSEPADTLGSDSEVLEGQVVASSVNERMNVAEPDSPEPSTTLVHCHSPAA